MSNTLNGLELMENSYREDEDADFDPINDVEEKSDMDSDEYCRTDIGEQSRSVNHPIIENTQDRLVKTRKERLLEAQDQRNKRYEELPNKLVSDKVQDLWEQLKGQSHSRLYYSGSIMSENINIGKENNNIDLKEEKILIKRTYNFAGETIPEQKWVTKSSAEAKEYLNSIVFKEQVIKPPEKIQKNDDKQLRRPLKRPPILEAIISGALRPKLTTLEKSKLDWASYVDKEGINEELQMYNKDGYLAKQDFLNRVESFKDQKYKQLRYKQLQQENQH